MFIERRHIKECPYKGTRENNRCECSIRIEDRKLGIREPLTTRDWKEAGRILRDRESAPKTTVADLHAFMNNWEKEAYGRLATSLQNAGIPAIIGGQSPDRRAITIGNAADLFIAHLNNTTDQGGERKKLSDDRMKKYDRLLTAFVTYCAMNDVADLADFNREHVRSFRQTWKDNPVKTSYLKKNEMLQGVFNYFVEEKLIEKNPVNGVQIPKQEEDFTTEKHIVSDEAWQKVTAQFGNLDARSIDRTTAFVLFMRESGCRIEDVVALERTHIKGKTYDLKARKNGKRNYGPLSDEVLAALAKIPDNGTPYFWWSGRGLLHSAISDWRRPLSTLFKLADVKINPHMFRHTKISGLLKKGFTPFEVAQVVGDTEKIILKHYWHSCPKYRADLIEKMRKLA